MSTTGGGLTTFGMLVGALASGVASGRATAIGWVSGIGRFGAVFGPRLGGVLIAGGVSQLGFAVFAAAGVLGAVMILSCPPAKGRLSAARTRR